MEFENNQLNIYEGPEIKGQISLLLKTGLSKKQIKNPSYSLRALARDLDVSPSFISQCLKGQKKFSLARALDFCELLPFSLEESEKLLKLAILWQLPGPKEREQVLSKLGVAPLSGELIT